MTIEHKVHGETFLVQNIRGLEGEGCLITVEYKGHTSYVGPWTDGTYGYSLRKTDINRGYLIHASSNRTLTNAINACCNDLLAQHGNKDTLSYLDETCQTMETWVKEHS